MVQYECAQCGEMMSENTTIITYDDSENMIAVCRQCYNTQEEEGENND